MKRIVIGLFISLCAISLWAQEKNPVPPPTSYRIDITLVEYDSGKKINTRQYSVYTTNRGETAVLRTSLRLPYAGEKGPQYLDIGFDMQCRLRVLSDAEGGGLKLDTDGQLSAMSPENGSGSNPPPLRRNQFVASTMVAASTSFVIASLDQLETNRRYDFVITVNKL